MPDTNDAHDNQTDRMPERPALAPLWLLLGALLVGFGAALGRGLVPGSFGLLVLGIWLMGAIMLGSSARAARIERVWRDAMRRRAAPFAAAALVVYGIVLAEVLGVYGALAVFCMAGFAGLLMAAVGGADRLASGLAASALAGASLLLGLGAAESALRHPSVSAMLGTGPELEQWDKRYDRLWERNVFGIRSPFESVARSGNSLRIVALGDSFTWGDKIATSDSTWPALLERWLAERLDQTVEVINLGRNGFTTANEAEMLRRVGWQFAPDVVLLQFFINDVLPSEPNFKSENSRYIFPSRRLIPSALRRRALGSSVLVEVLEGQYSSWRNRAPGNPWLAQYEDGVPGWEQFKAALHEVGEAAASRGVPAYFVVYPWFERGVWTPESYMHRQIHERAIAVAEAAGFRIVDLTPVFLDGKTDGREFWATPYDSHPSAATNLLAARVLGDALLEDGIVELTQDPLRPLAGRE
jgi:lysophospholipase L1-like esterase